VTTEAVEHRRPGLGPLAADGGPGPGGMRRLGMPRPVSVRAGPAGMPARVGDVPVDAVREDWVVEDRWWTGEPLRRRYLELVLADGRDIVVFRDLEEGGWYAQRA
jgi:hypothetical protein